MMKGFSAKLRLKLKHLKVLKPPYFIARLHVAVVLSAS